jgi:hypothetical protein
MAKKDFVLSIVHRSTAGAFVLSLDCELLWGCHYIGGTSKFKYLQDQYAACYDNLLALLDKYDVHATFAFVGALGIEREEFERLTLASQGDQYKGRLQSIFDKSIHETELWYNKNLINKVIHANQKHEIASHSFSHLRFTDSIVTKDVALREFELSCRILGQYTEEAQIKTFIYPENCIAHLDVFHDGPFRLYRGCNESWFKNLPFKRLFHFIDQILPLAPPSVMLRVDDYGNYFLPGSFMLFRYDGIRRLVPDGIRLMKIKRGIDRAIRMKKIFHLWFHPWNLGSSKRMTSLLIKILEYVDAQRSANSLQVATMSEVLDHAGNYADDAGPVGE